MKQYLEKFLRKAGRILTTGIAVGGIVFSGMPQGMALAANAPIQPASVLTEVVKAPLAAQVQLRWRPNERCTAGYADTGAAQSNWTEEVVTVETGNVLMVVAGSITRFGPDGTNPVTAGGGVWYEYPAGTHQVRFDTGGACKGDPTKARDWAFSKDGSGCTHCVKFEDALPIVVNPQPVATPQAPVLYTVPAPPATVAELHASVGIPPAPAAVPTGQPLSAFAKEDYTSRPNDYRFVETDLCRGYTEAVGVVPIPVEIRSKERGEIIVAGFDGLRSQYGPYRLNIGPGAYWLEVTDAGICVGEPTLVSAWGDAEVARHAAEGRTVKDVAGMRHASNGQTIYSEDPGVYAMFNGDNDRWVNAKNQAIADANKQAAQGGVQPAGTSCPQFATNTAVQETPDTFGVDNPAVLVLFDPKDNKQFATVVEPGKPVLFTGLGGKRWEYAGCTDKERLYREAAATGLPVISVDDLKARGKASYRK